MYSRFVILQIRPAGREIRRAVGSPELPVRRLPAEWAATEAEPVQFRLPSLPSDTPLATLVRTAKPRWRIAYDYGEMRWMGRAVGGAAAGPWLVFPVLSSSRRGRRRGSGRSRG
ncbi:hypothetical protein ABT088_47065 [Streptomyces mirabilis]|uniref:hypothetical protein n=1 Tax=Streptomyces sp. AK02-04a TaxID=3028649 RepID=UPI0029A5CF53|nr:hypothetical protein [Streptomyces sp. AK02-04a]MDX3762082.1 hypothetical protein [Streptomyces sp. AK02-04a]